MNPESSPGFPNRAILWPQSNMETIVGHHINLTPLQDHHAEALFLLLSGQRNAHLWESMPAGPFRDMTAFTSHINFCLENADECWWAVVDRAKRTPVGYLRCAFSSPVEGKIHIGYFILSSSLQGQPGATEAWALLADRAFAAGFRMVFWSARFFKASPYPADPVFGHEFRSWSRGTHFVKGMVYDSATYYMTDEDWAHSRESIHRWIANV